MENIQINGQRRWGPPKDWTGPPPPHGTEIFLKNLSDDVYEQEIFSTFSAAGRIFEVRLPVHWSGENRGYAFVRFTRVEEADAAVTLFDRFQMRPGKPIRAERSVDNTRLFLSAVQKDKTARDIKRDLAELVENVERVYVYPTLEDRNVYRGYAFVEFQTHRDAAIAKRILTPDVCSAVFEKKCIAAWANPLPFLDGNVRRTINVLFVRNIPKDMKNFELKKELKDLLGEDDACRIKRLKNFAFLTFTSHDQAEIALHKLQSEISFTNRYQIEVDWAVPREIAHGFSGQLKQKRDSESNPFYEKSENSGPELSTCPTVPSVNPTVRFLKAVKKSQTDCFSVYRPLPGPLFVSVPEPVAGNFGFGSATVSRPIRGSKFSPPVSFCDSDNEDSLSPPSTVSSNLGEPGFVPYRPFGEVSPFPLGISRRVDLL